MTDLTEQWKKGELEDGWYWVEGSRVEGIYAYTAEYLNKIYRPRNSERIVEQVPTYQEYLESEAHCTVYSEENKQLRQLLKDVRKLWKGKVFMPDNQEQIKNILSRINAVIGESEE